MNLDEAQRKRVAEWIAEGLKLSEIQNRLASELGIRMTYMDVRFLVDDLKLTPKDVEPPKAPSSPLGTPAAAGKDNRAATGGEKPEPEATGPAPGGGVAIAVDQLARPGAVVSGNVTFKDGNKADWYIDQTGRLGVVPRQKDYRPTAQEVQEFQMALENELVRLGY